MQLFGRKSRTQIEKLPDGQDRLPPGQYLTAKWPVLSYERTPQKLPTNWKLKIKGLVEHPFELTWEELLALPRTTITSDIHCVTTWSRYDNTWEGVHIREILQRAKPLPEAKYVMAHSWTGTVGKRSRVGWAVCWVRRNGETTIRAGASTQDSASSRACCLPNSVSSTRDKSGLGIPMLPVLSPWRIKTTCIPHSTFM